jgi:hypothetical protein
MQRITGRRAADRDDNVGAPLVRSKPDPTRERLDRQMDALF